MMGQHFHHSQLTTWRVVTKVVEFYVSLALLLNKWVKLEEFDLPPLLFYLELPFILMRNYHIIY